MPGLELVEIPVSFNADSSSADSASADSASADSASADPGGNSIRTDTIAPAELYGSRDFSLTFARLQEAAGVRTLQALAELFRVRMAFVSDVKRREKIPATWLYHLLLTRRISPQWIIFGTGPKELALVDMVDESIAALLLKTATE